MERFINMFKMGGGRKSAERGTRFPTNATPSTTEMVTGQQLFRGLLIGVKPTGAVSGRNSHGGRRVLPL